MSPYLGKRGLFWERKFAKKLVLKKRENYTDLQVKCHGKKRGLILQLISRLST